MDNLGVLYAITREYGKALEWFQRSADAGNPDAMKNLGLLYEYGKGVTQDYGKALEWYQKTTDADPENTYAKEALSRLKNARISRGIVGESQSTSGENVGSRSKSQTSTYRSTRTNSQQFKGPLVLTPFGMKLRTPFTSVWDTTP
jgi:TPR repeat protein